ncbi:glycosyl transferase family 90 [Helicobacter aurati]|uniref:glycosyl transferase family 90 n=1 Tax=Helicobacter aurati TaxID=137778 RepID=UPI001FD2A796|nr:glycosyl transferase family 90 [Helicobacter aurati]
MRRPRLLYNIQGIIKAKIPKIFFQKKLESSISRIFRMYDKQWDILQKRVNFCNQLQQAFVLPQSESELPPKTTIDNSKQFSPFSRLYQLDVISPHIDNIRNNSAKFGSVYYFDSEEWLRYFPNSLRWAFLYNDVSSLLNTPSIVKSRPIVPQNDCSVLLQLEKYRHFQFVHDTMDFKDKKDMLLFRGAVYQKHRIRFFHKYFFHPQCDIGHVGRVDPTMTASHVTQMLDSEMKLAYPDQAFIADTKNITNANSQYTHSLQNLHELWRKPKLPIAAHLPYKFLLSLEGYDVASNLKWILSSNSLCIMPKPEMETWFMESSLKADVHYVAIDNTYSDLIEKMEYYRRNTDEAQEIIHNAHKFCEQFFDAKLEAAINLLVLRKYFYLSSQLDISKEEQELFTV